MHTHTENIDMRTVCGAFTASLNSCMSFEEVLLFSFYRLQTSISTDSIPVTVLNPYMHNIIECSQQSYEVYVLLSIPYKKRDEGQSSTLSCSMSQ